MSHVWTDVTKQMYATDIFRRMPEVYAFIGEVVAGLRRQDLTMCDIGCGDGSLMEQLRRYGDICGVDIVEPHLETARKKGLRVDSCNVDEVPLPYADGAFDVVVPSEVIEHVLVPDRLLWEARRVMRDDGMLVLTTPNLASFGKRLLLLTNRNPFIECSPIEPEAVGHLRYFIYPTLQLLMHRCGFRIERFSSDVVNFDGRGRMASRWLARRFPTFGRTLMVVARKREGWAGPVPAGQAG